MRMPKFFVYFSVCFIAIFVGCEKPNENANTTATTTVSPPATQNLTVVPRPQKIVDMMKARGEQDEASPQPSVRPAAVHRPPDRVDAQRAAFPDT